MISKLSDIYHKHLDNYTQNIPSHALPGQHKRVKIASQGLLALSVLLLSASTYMITNISQKSAYDTKVQEYARNDSIDKKIQSSNSKSQEVSSHNTLLSLYDSKDVVLFPFLTYLCAGLGFYYKDCEESIQKKL